jgi:hypothetical protein
MRKLFIPTKNRKKAVEYTPRWACRLARVTGGYMAFDSQEALDAWRMKVDQAKHRNA